jgi:hypothetical protein
VGGARWAEAPAWANEMPAEDALWARPATPGAPPSDGDPAWAGETPAEDALWARPGPPGALPWDGDPAWAGPSGASAPPRDDGAYWGQPSPPWAGEVPTGQDAGWGPGAAPGPPSWVAGDTPPMPLMDPVGPGRDGPAGMWDATGRTTILPGGGPGSAEWPGAGQPGAGGSAPGRRRRFWAPALAIVVAVGLVAAIVVVTRHHDTGSPGATPTAGGVPTAGGDGTAGTQETPGTLNDPISVANIFPLTHVSIDGLPFTQVTGSTVTTCASAANGAFASALVSAGCRRVVRATYVDSGQQYAVTAGVAALPTHDAALMADAAKRFGPDVWFTALDGPAGSGASAIARTVGVGCDVVDTRFIVFALSTYSNGRNPTGHAPEVATLTGLSQSFISLVQQSLTPQGGS